MIYNLNGSFYVNKIDCLQKEDAHMKNHVEEIQGVLYFTSAEKEKRIQ